MMMFEAWVVTLLVMGMYAIGFITGKYIWNNEDK